ncbi:MerR family transcriptional regulator [Paenibacillus terrae]|uniref:MerR family transcriptional regulator n=1 Tax=Paenibacillus terrae (strain HPL-003) TaxID=985665 RepID=G7VW97_PAETH|nr:MerR family transcriptional regulator [Paenibacillus terrae]AET58898.1 MerR family transcriptional regulator [Paenibacillus terrae HPL-003]
MFTIKEVADKTGITAHTLRYYEREGIMPSVKRDAGGNRFYDEESIEGLNFILALRSTGMPLSKIKQYVSLYLEGESTMAARKQILQDHRAKVEEDLRQTIKHLEQINYKLGLYYLQENGHMKMLL